MDLTVEICGMSGDGTIAAGGILNEAVSRAGLFVMAFDSYPAEIRGFGRCVTRTRIGTDPVNAMSDETDVLVSLDDTESRSRLPVLVKNARVLFDNRPPTLVEEGVSLAAHALPGWQLYGIPFRELAVRAAGSPRGRNLAALGALAALLGLQEELFLGVIRERFAAKGEPIAAANANSFLAGFTHMRETFPREEGPFHEMGPATGTGGRELLSGNIAAARGAIDAGLKLYFGYPITPATAVMEYLARALPAKGGRMVQMEDEMASIGGVLGSFFAGSRAMTATSGPGLALMTELIGQGVMSETPAVILDVQRGGPSTGLPTKTEQSDLLAAIYGSPGDAPRIVLAPGTVEECYHYTRRSFQIAERYQVPVILLSDFFLGNRVENVALPPPDALDLEGWNLYPPADAQWRYRRYELTGSGISPRAVPGMEGYAFTASGLEHTEEGSPDYSAENHMRMSAKRLRKLASALGDLPAPQEFSGDKRLDVGLIAWGSTFGTALDAVESLRKTGGKVGALKITTLFPYHAEVIRAFMERCPRVLIPELNLQGQLASLIGHLCSGEIFRLNLVTGSPMAVNVIRDKIKALL